MEKKPFSEPVLTVYGPVEEVTERDQHGNNGHHFGHHFGHNMSGA